jgi:hypothetical protein
MFAAFRNNNRGKKFGNEIADSLNMERSVFHAAIEEGGLPMHFLVLAGFKDDGISINEAKKTLHPSLFVGLSVLKERFGDVPKINRAFEALEGYESVK